MLKRPCVLQCVSKFCIHCDFTLTLNTTDAKRFQRYRVRITDQRKEGGPQLCGYQSRTKVKHKVHSLSVHVMELEVVEISCIMNLLFPRALWKLKCSPGKACIHQTFLQNKGYMSLLCRGWFELRNNNALVAPRLCFCFFKYLLRTVGYLATHDSCRKAWREGSGRERAFDHCHYLARAPSHVSTDANPI